LEFLRTLLFSNIGTLYFLQLSLCWKLQIQQTSEFTNDVNRFHFLEIALNLYLISFSQTPFFEIKIKKGTFISPLSRATLNV